MKILSIIGGLISIVSIGTCILVLSLNSRVLECEGGFANLGPIEILILFPGTEIMKKMVLLD